MGIIGSVEIRRLGFSMYWYVDQCGELLNEKIFPPPRGEFIPPEGRSVRRLRENARNIARAMARAYREPRREELVAALLGGNGE